MVKRPVFIGSEMVVTLQLRHAARIVPLTAQMHGEGSFQSGNDSESETARSGVSRPTSKSGGEFNSKNSF